MLKELPYKSSVICIKLLGGDQQWGSFLYTTFVHRENNGFVNSEKNIHVASQSTIREELSFSQTQSVCLIFQFMTTVGLSPFLRGLLEIVKQQKFCCKQSNTLKVLNMQ